MNPAQFFGNGFNFDFGSFAFAPSYLQAGLIIFLLFILVLTLAQIRRHFVDWSVKGAIFGIFFGFLLALILEGFLIIGGKTAVTELLGWKQPPKPIADLLEIGRVKLVQVLGVSSEIPRSVAKVSPTAKDMVDFFQALSPNEAGKVRKIICQP